MDLRPCCPQCGADLQPGWRFCEVCGCDQLARSGTTPRLLFSGESDVLELDRVAGVTDRGKRRDLNEDSLAVGQLNDAVAVVVCDGVASSPGSAVAANHAAQAGLRELLVAVTRGDEPSAATTSAALAAAHAAALAGSPTDDNPPCCTYVSVLIIDDCVTVGWIGDSPAYWAGPEGLRRLTVDDSAAGRLIAGGAAFDDPRLAEPGAHALQRWLGADAPDPHPQVRRFTPSAPGVVIVCSDGLSRYVDAGLIAPPDHLADPVAVVGTLLGRALAAGGHDNITIAAITVAGGGQSG
ncbi:protein phosphatase 2C domain-containing protein [Actinokineospora inagensis]|uniref:protein phosphatase 2C domain-containing protein n=1 Tax=Actinokineospora inagensis TaxID=103730 RepID=UPI0003FCCE01|nr:protein phosphatase 2C domain-containing protein [Actinokineospora inagensis]